MVDKYRSQAENTSRKNGGLSDFQENRRRDG
jgi:hypothetical protein